MHDAVQKGLDDYWAGQLYLTTDEFDNVPYFHVNGEWEPDVTQANYMPLPEPPKEET